MNSSIIALTATTVSTYISIGSTSYKQHYQHLWENGDSSPYLKSSFTEEIVQKELENSNLAHFLVYYGKKSVGIVKLILDAAIGDYTPQDALLLEKVYLLKEYAGRGIGRKVLSFVEAYALERNKGALWLDTMKNGPALYFYLSYGFEIWGDQRLEFENVREGEKPMYILGKRL